MVHELFDTSAIYYDDYDLQSGSGLGVGLPEYYRGGSVYQRGYGIQTGAGIGDIFKGLWRFFRPLLQRVGTSVGEEALNTGQRVLEKLKEGKPIKEAVITEGKRGIDSVLEQGGLPKQFGTGRRRGRRSIKRQRVIETQPNPQNIVPSTINEPIVHSKKRLRADIFGLY
jgi:hypothetical protein